MPTRRFPRIKWWIALLLLGVIVLLNAGYVWWKVEWDDTPDPRFISNHPQFNQVHLGQTKAQVVSILGTTPKPVVPRYQRKGDWPGPVPPRVQDEEWVFEFEGWNGGINVYFDEQGKVVNISYGYA